MMRFTARKTFRLGPLRLNTTNGRITSWSLKFGRLSRNSQRGWTLDTPGLGSIKFGNKKRT